MLAVDMAALSRIEADIARARVRLRAELDELEADVRPLAERWDGAARRAYGERREAWRRAADELTALLGEIGGAVEASAADYRSTERRNRALFD